MCIIVWRTGLCSYVGLARTVIHTVYDRIFGDFPAKNTVCKPYIFGSGQPYTYAVLKVLGLNPGQSLVHLNQAWFRLSFWVAAGLLTLLVWKMSNIYSNLACRKKEVHVCWPCLLKREAIRLLTLPVQKRSNTSTARACVREKQYVYWLCLCEKEAAGLCLGSHWKGAVGCFLNIYAMHNL